MYVYPQYRSQPQPRRRHRTTARILLVLAFITVLGSINYLRPLPAATASTLPTNSNVDTAQLAWPPNAASALGAMNYGVLATHGPQSPLPTASLAKVITALAVLQQKPLSPGKQGPVLTLNDNDVALYNRYLGEDGSVAKVQAGEQLTEYQALQAMLLVSANNMADTLAIWAYGSLPNYTKAANKLVQQWGLAQTTVGADASGFLPSTKSTPDDLVQLAQRALSNPVLASINTMPSANIPVAGILQNSNQRMSKNGITVLKTGLTDQAGGCLLFTATTTVGSQAITLVGAILGAHDLVAALDGASALMASAKQNFVVQTPVLAGQQFGTITTPWGATAPIKAQTSVTIIAWKGAALTPRVELNAIDRAMELGAPVGSIIINSKGNQASSPITLGKAITAPPFSWRLLRH